MPKGSKRSYTTKKSSRTSPVEKNGQKNGSSRGTSTARAKQMAYTAVSKEESGGKRSGSSRGKRVTRSASTRSSQKSARP